MERKLTAILAADVVGYSKLMTVDEEATLAQLKAHRANLFDPKVAEHKGRIIKLMGDGTLVEFASVIDAVNCAIAIQSAPAETNENIRLRIGINLGDVIVDGEDIYGDDVNIAARLETLAEPGGVCISDLVYQSIRSKVDATFVAIGEQQLKNIDEPIRAWRWSEHGAGLADRSDFRPPELPDKPSIVVLPFTNMSGDPEQDYFSDGITEDIITELGRFNSLFVIARNSSFTFKNKTTKVQEIARELGVEYVVEGSVRKAGDRVRITVQLINAKTGNHVWGERYDRELTDLFLIQDEITQNIVGTLAITLEDQTLEKAKGKRPEDLRVYEHWIRGKKFLWTAGQQNLEARRHFEKAIALDPDFAHAHAGLAVSHIMAAVDFPTGAEFKLGQQRAFDSAQLALTLDSTAYQAHVSLAWVFLYRSDYERGKKHVDLAMKLNPNDADTLANAAYLLASYGSADEAVRVGETAFRLNPRHPDWYVPYFCWALFNARRYEESLNIRLTQPDVFVDGRFCGAATLAYLGRIEEARLWVEIGMADLKARPVGSELPGRNTIQLILDNNPLNRQEDRGGQYSSDDFRNELARNGIDCSMSSTGNCYDNAVVESFFGVLKRERVIRVRYRNRDEARADLFEYIEVFYNRKRRHGYLGNISPVDFEDQSNGSF